MILVGEGFEQPHLEIDGLQADRFLSRFFCLPIDVLIDAVVRIEAKLDQLIEQNSTLSPKQR